MATASTKVTGVSPFAERRAWRFSLGALFRATTVVALALFAAVQLSPLAAARDMGVALGIAAVLAALTARSWRWGLAAGLLALAGFVPTIVAAGVPFSERSAICLECGMSREIHSVWGWSTKDETTDTEASRWAAPLLPAGHSHIWTICSNHSRTTWFGSSVMACGGPGEGAFMAWQLARLGDPPAGERALREYLDIRSGKSPKSLALHSQEVSDAVNAAIRAKQQTP